MKTPILGTKGRRVPGNGPRDARILVLGEAPGEDEERLGMPFVGVTGRFLWEQLARLGVPREAVRVENVSELRPERNKLYNLSPLTIRRAQQECWDRLALCTPTVIVPMGNLALNTLRGTPLPLTKKGTWKLKTVNGEQQIQWQDKIGNWRGSIFGAVGRKIIPTWHPAYILRDAHAYPTWVGDLRRIIADSAFPELALDDPHEVLLDPARHERDEFLERCYALEDKTEAFLAVDVETPGGRVACVGLAVSDRWGMVVPVRADTREFLRRVMCSPIQKTFHFGMFDAYMLAREGWPVAKWWWDSRDLHHLLDPSDRHTLAYCCSRDRRTAFWKDERMYGARGGDKGEYTKRALAPTQWRALMEGCGKDVCHTWGLTALYRDRVRDAGLLDHYHDHKRRLSWACLELARTGIQVDRGRWESYRAECEAKLRELRETMRGLAGEDLVAKQGLARVRVARYFYQTLGCRPFKKRGTNNLTTDEVHIRKLMLRYKKAQVGGAAVLAFAHYAKRRGWFESTLTEDDRFCSQYALVPESGRLSSSATCDGLGNNGQNIDRSLRDCFIASRPGWGIMKVDCSQAENRLVDGASGDPRALVFAQTPSWELDQYRLLAAEVLGVEPETVTKEDRDVIGKRGKLAYNYGMEGFRFSEVLLLESESQIIRTPEECTAILEQVGAKRPYIAQYQEWIREMILTDGRIPWSWGDALQFPWYQYRLSKEDFKAGYADWAQGEVGKLLNQLGFLPCRRFLRRERMQARIIQQEHDALAVEGPPEELWRILHECLVPSLSSERTYPGRGGAWPLRMPVGVTIGRTLKGSVEWKREPSREEFLETARQVVSGHRSTPLPTECGPSSPTTMNA